MTLTRKLAESQLAALRQEEESLLNILDQEAGSILNPELVESRLDKVSVRVQRAEAAVIALGGKP